MMDGQSSIMSTSAHWVIDHGTNEACVLIECARTQRVELLMIAWQARSLIYAENSKMPIANHQIHWTSNLISITCFQKLKITKYFEVVVVSLVNFAKCFLRPLVGSTPFYCNWGGSNADHKSTWQYKKNDQRATYWLEKKNILVPYTIT